jgi:hypothetical protein
MSNGHIQWGKVLAGAAIAGAAVTAFVFATPALQETIVPAIEKLATSIGSSIATAWSWIGQNVIGYADFAAKGAADAAAATAETLKAAVEAALASGDTTLAAAGEYVKNTIVPMADKTAGQLGKIAADNSQGLIEFIVNNKTATIATAAAVGGLIAANSHAHHRALPREMTQPPQDSFAMREDMRRMQALMQARMAATGYQPAMANQQGRGA